MSSLEFVNSSGPATGDTDENRRKVRSQAMKDYRRRQRLEAANKVPDKQSRTPNDDNHLPVRSKGSRSGSVASKVGTSKTRPKYSTQGENLTSTMSLNKEDEDAFTIDEVPVPLTFEQWGPAFTNQQGHIGLSTGSSPSSRREYQQTSWPAGHPPRAKSPTAAPEPSVWPDNFEDPFDSPEQIGQMFGFCKSYIHWLRPGTDADVAGKIFSQAWSSSKKPMLLAACCLASVGHLDAVQPNRPGGNYALYKARVLREVSERMQSPSTATSNETIGALGCLLSYEMSKGSEEATTHLRGLKSIVNIKGGLPESESAGLQSMLETLDLVHAVVFDVQPILTEKVTSPWAELEQSDARVFERLIPLLAAEQDAYQRMQTPHSESTQQMPELLRSATACLENESSDDVSPNLPTANLQSLNGFRSSLEHFGRHSCRDNPIAPDALPLARACYLVASILYNLVVNRMPHRHGSNQIYVNELWTAIKSIRDRAWAYIPYLRLYILLTGAVTAMNRSCRTFFKAQLVRCMYQMGVNEWKRTKTFVLRFIEMKNTLERFERRSTPPAELFAVPASRRPSAAFLYPHSKRRSSSGTSLSKANPASISNHLPPRTAREPSKSSASGGGTFMRPGVAPSSSVRAKSVSHPAIPTHHGPLYGKGSLDGLAVGTAPPNRGTKSLTLDSTDEDRFTPSDWLSQT